MLTLDGHLQVAFDTKILEKMFAKQHTTAVDENNIFNKLS